MKKLLNLLPAILITVQVMANNTNVPVILHDSIVKLNQSDFSFVEGPAWDSSEYVYFSDIPAGKIYRYSKSDGIEVFIMFANGANTNGLYYKFGRLFVCESGDKQVSTYNFQGIRTSILSDNYNGEEFNSPNDLFVDESGGVYFTDPAFGKSPVIEEAVYYIDKNGNTSRIITGLEKPNGIILTNDGTKLIVADTYDENVYCWDISSNGVVENKQVYCTLGTEPGMDTPSGADGMAMDKLGYLYVTSAIGVQVFDTTGAIHDTIVLPETPANCTFGGDSLDELYITARRGLYMVPVNFPSQSSLPTGAAGIINHDRNPGIGVSYTGNGVVLSNLPNNSRISLYNLQGKLIGKFTSSLDQHEVSQGLYNEKLIIVKVEGTRDGKVFIASRKVLL
jgi:gluconolactonase